jgi:DivIVA domain-containing protein
VPDHSALIEKLRDPRLPVVRWREGYRSDEVDPFLERAADALAGTGTTLTVADVEDVRFTAVRLKPGYEMRAVDDLLDEIVDGLRAG